MKRSIVGWTMVALAAYTFMWVMLSCALTSKEAHTAIDAATVCVDLAIMYNRPDIIAACKTASDVTHLIAELQSTCKVDGDAGSK